MKKLRLPKTLLSSTLTVIILFATWMSLVPLPAAVAQAQQPYKIELLGRSFTPKQGVSPRLEEVLRTTEHPRIHAIVQFKKDLTLDEHKFLAESGIKLQGYVGGRAYHASIPRGTKLTRGNLGKLVRHADFMKPTDKLKADLAKRRYEDWAYDPATKKVKVLVEFFPDVDADTIKRALGEAGLKGEPDGAANSWAISVEEDRIADLAALDIVKTLQQGPTPFLPLNRGSRRLGNTDAAQLATYTNPQPSFQSVSGQGIRIGICDSGVDEGHDDFDEITTAGAAGASRVYNQRAGSGSHGTHVASIAGGNGFNSVNNGLPAFSLAGHAPRAMIGDYSQFSGNEDLFYGAIVNDNTLVTNHSYVQTATDFYDTTAADLDRIVRGDANDFQGRAIPARPQVWAAGNNGTAAQYGDEEGYYSVFTTAKNTISVGSLDTLDGRLSDFSSIGPTFDGRIKPDVVAPGCNDSIASPSVGIQAASSGSQGYTGKCGTSMAAPVVSGIVALLAEQYQATFGVAPSNLRPSTYKAILVQTADDREKTRAYLDREFNNPDTGQSLLYHAGPDFVTGFGLVNADEARRLIGDSSRWRESNAGTTGDVDTFCVSVLQGAEQLKVTLTWDDEPGDTTTAETTPKLVNDLDLTLTEPDTGNIFRPWTLDLLPLTANPGDGSADPITTADVKPAYRGVDRRNNVEMASVFLPRKGVWKAKVKAHNLPNGNVQRYSLATSHRILPTWLCPGIRLCDLFPQFCRFEFIPIEIKDKLIIIDPRSPVPIDEICKYVIQCPGCDGPGWGYCPGWRMDMTRLPPDVIVSLVDDRGQVVSRDSGVKPERAVTLERARPGQRHFLLFTDAKGEPYKKPVAFEAKVTKIPTK